MVVHTQRRLLDKLFGARLTVIVGDSDSGAITHALSHEAIEPIRLEVVSFLPAAGEGVSTLRFVGSNADTEVELPCPPSAPCLPVALSEQGRAELELFLSWWTEHGPARPPEILLTHCPKKPLDSDQDAFRATIYHQLMQILIRENIETNKRQAEVSEQLYELRLEYEQARSAMASLQTELDSLQQSAFRMSHLSPPEDRTIGPEARERFEIRQPLSVSAAGLAGFDLYLPRQAVSSIGRGHLLVTLHSEARRTELGTWRLAYESLEAGWIGCVFKSALTDPVHHLYIRVAWETVKGSPPRLALSSLGPFQELAASANGQSIGMALALLAWSTIPGSLIREYHGLRSSSGDVTAEPGTFEYVISKGDISRIKPLVSAPFMYCHPLNDVPGFRLHPLNDTLASAMLRDACIVGTDRLVALVQVRHEQAKDIVEYAMFLSLDDTLCPDSSEFSEHNQSVLAFSGWQPVRSDNRPHPVTLTLDKPLTHPAHLYFATRMGNGHPNTHHWADWLEVCLRVAAETRHWSLSKTSD